MEMYLRMSLFDLAKCLLSPPVFPTAGWQATVGYKPGLAKFGYDR